VAINLDIRKGLNPPVEIPMPNPLYASVATNQGIKVWMSWKEGGE
jgi:hypothetical protein